MKQFCILLLLGLFLAVSSFAATQSSVSQYGITWNFDKAYEVGQFVTGDWWVKGPVTVTSVSPTPSSSRNGSMINPSGGTQAYDSRGAQFSTSGLATFPKLIQPTSSLVSSVSKGGGTDWSEFKNVGCLQSQAVLTIVSSAPAANSFRPGYAGTYKTIFNTSEVVWGNLPMVASPTNVPNGSDVLRLFARPRIDHNTNWGIQYSCAEDNWGNCYGREVSNAVSAAAMYMMLDTPLRQQVAIQLIQYGIDLYSVLKAGGGWPKDMNNPGGHFSGRKFPIVLAGVMLNDATLKNFDRDFTNELLFQEDLQVYRGNNGKALWGSPCTSCYLSNGCVYNTSCPNGSRDCRDVNGLRDGCDAYRVCCTSKTWVGQALATRMLGAMDVWNYDVYFEYVDRWVVERSAVETKDSYIYGSTFVKDMWVANRNNLPEPSGVSFTASPISGKPPLQVTFSNTSQGTFNSWSWDFGDGNTSAVQNPVHTYTTLGSFTVKLTGSGGSDGTKTYEWKDYIKVTDELVIEGEDMTLNGYILDTHPATAGQVIMVDPNLSIGSTGEATKSFSGASGIYNISLLVVPENDGAPLIDLYVGTSKVISETYPMEPGYHSLTTKVEFTVSGIQVNQGEVIKIVGTSAGTASAGAFARMDKIVFSLTGSVGMVRNPHKDTKAQRIQESFTAENKAVYYSLDGSLLVSQPTRPGIFLVRDGQVFRKVFVVR